MNILNILKSSFNRVKDNKYEYIISNIFFQILRIILFIPIYSILFSFILKRSNVTSITDKTIINLLKTPSALIFTIILLTLMAFLVFYELAYYFLLADNQRNNYKYNLKDIFRKINKKAKYFISFYFVIFILYFLILLPIAKIGLNVNQISNIKIPNFITDELLISRSGSILYYSLVAIIMYVTLRLIYTVYFFVTKEINIKQAMKKSIDYSKGKTIKNIILMLLVFLIIGIITSILTFISFIPFYLTERLFSKLSLFSAALTVTLMQLVMIIMTGISQVFIVNVVLETVNTENKEVIKKDKLTFNHLKNWINEKLYRKIITIVLILVIYISNVVLVSHSLYKPDTAIIAHRGFMKYGVENSITALKSAADYGAEMVELDIQETKDNKFVVIHDYNLKRLASIDKNVYDMTLDELEKVKIKQNGFTDTIPSLEEFIDISKQEDIKLLIEVKPHGKESPDMEKNLVELLKRKGIANKCIVQSLDINVLDNIKEIDKDIYTCFIIPVMFGKIPNTEHNFLCLEDFSVTKGVIDKVYEDYDGLFVWTINKESLMKKYFNLKVDGIITNNLDTAINIRENNYENSFLNKIENILLR